MASENLLIPFSEWDDADKKEAALLPEGDYVLRVVSVETTKIKTGTNEGTPGLVVWFQPVNGPYADSFIVDRFYIMKSTLWRFAAFLRAAGLKVTQNDMSLPYNKLVGRQVTATLVDGDEYKNKRKSEVSGYAPVPRNSAMSGSGLTEETELVPESNIDTARADTILKGAYEVEGDPWALSSDVEL